MMPDTGQSSLPQLVVVTGRPGAGKTTLARLLGRHLRVPVLCRDELKEGRLRTGPPAEDVARQVYTAFFATMQLLLEHRITLIGVAAFQHKLWAKPLDVIRRTARVKIVVCSVRPEIALARRIQRGLADPLREQCHPDPAIQAARDGDTPLPDDYDPPALNMPTLHVDTTDEYRPSLDEIAAFATR